MAATQSSIRDAMKTNTGEAAMTEKDRAESLLQNLDGTTKESTGISLFHILTLGSIGASIALFLSGKKEAGIFVGLWPPTFQALKAVVDKKSAK